MVKYLFNIIKLSSKGFKLWSFSFFYLILIILFSCSSEKKNDSSFDLASYNEKRKQAKENKKEEVKLVSPFKKIDNFDYSILKAPSGKFINKQFKNALTATFYTNYGDMIFELYPKRMPLAVENFVNLVQNGFYNGCEFFRIEEDFIIQAGDRTNTGYADAGYYFETEYHDDLSHGRFGVLSYANNNTKTNSSQFFITLASNRQLDKQHPPFGFIYSGHDVLRDIGGLPVDDNNKPQVKVHIRRIEIRGL